MNATLTSKHVGDNGSKSKVHAMPNSDVDGRKAVCGRSVKWVNANAHGYDHEVTCLACVKVMRATEATENTDRFIAESEARVAGAQTVVESAPETCTCAASYLDSAIHEMGCAKEGKWDAVLRTTSSAGFNTVPEVGYVGVRQALVGFGGDEHIHLAGCRDIRREMRKFGQREGDTFPYPAGVTVWNVIEENDGGRASDSYTVGTLEHAQEMVWNANAELRFMPCASMQLGMTPFGPLIMAEDGNYMISEEAPVCPNCGQPEGDDITLHGAACRFCGSDGHATCQHAFELDNTVPTDDLPYDVEFVDRYPHGRSGAEDTTAVHEVFRKGTRVMVKATGHLGTVVQPYMTGVMESTGTRFSALRLTMDSGEYLSRLMGDVSLLESQYDALVDNIMDTLTVDALLSVDVDGIKVSLGWHTFTVKRGDERTIPTIYGEAHGEWNRPTAADWDSIITVEDSKTY